MGYKGNKGYTGYKKLIVWQNTKVLRKLIYDITGKFPKIEMRRISQMRDAARSTKQNIQEGYIKRGRKEYIRFLGIARGSLSELRGDVEDSYEDKLITESEFKKVNEIICKTDYLFNNLIKSLSQNVNYKTPITPIAPITPVTPKRGVL